MSSLTRSRGFPFLQHAVIVLRYYADLTETDIAHTLECRPGTVKSLAFTGSGGAVEGDHAVNVAEDDIRAVLDRRDQRDARPQTWPGTAPRP